MVYCEEKNKKKSGLVINFTLAAINIVLNKIVGAVMSCYECLYSYLTLLLGHAELSCHWSWVLELGTDQNHCQVCEIYVEYEPITDDRYIISIGKTFQFPVEMQGQKYSASAYRLPLDLSLAISPILLLMPKPIYKHTMNREGFLKVSRS